MTEPAHEVTQPRSGLFLVSRTSDWAEENGAPCERAKKITIIATDTRAVDDPRKIPAFKGGTGDWYLNGSNHRVVGGKIKRDIGAKSV